MAETAADKERAVKVAQAQRAADAVKAETADAGSINVLVASEHLHRQKLADDMVELAKKPISETVPGGKYIGEDGEEHDAEGRKLGKDGKPIDA